MYPVNSSRTMELEKVCVTAPTYAAAEIIEIAIGK